MEHLKDDHRSVSSSKALHSFSDNHRRCWHLNQPRSLTLERPCFKIAPSKVWVQGSNFHWSSSNKPPPNCRTRQVTLSGSPPRICWFTQAPPGILSRWVWTWLHSVLVPRFWEMWALYSRGGVLQKMKHETVVFELFRRSSCVSESRRQSKPTAQRYKQYKRHTRYVVPEKTGALHIVG